MKQTIDPKFNRFLKDNRLEMEPSERSINRIREIAANKVLDTNKTSNNWYFGLAAICLLLIAVIGLNPFSKNDESLIVLNSDLTADLFELDESIQSIYESIDADLVLLTENENLNDEIFDISTDINQILDEF